MLEFGQIAAGPFAGSLLVDLGSDVVKVENPKGGDGMRGWPPLPSKDGGPVASENFASLNRNKRSITADLKNDSDVARLKEPIKFTNVIVENFRAGVMGRLGLGYQALEPINPSLVYCSISGYGQSGPHADKGGVRCHGARHQRFDERHRRSRPSACQMRRAGRRFLRQALRGLYHHGGRHAGTADRPRRLHRLLDAGRVAGRGGAADQRVFRNRQVGRPARLGPSAQCALSGLSRQG